MALRLRNIRLALDDPPQRVLNRVTRRLRVPPDAIATYAIVRQSLDARDSHDLHFNCTVELALRDGPQREQACIKRLHGRNVEWIEPVKSASPTPGDQPLTHRPVIIGFGPAGMFAALRLAELGYAPLVLERGRDVRRRHKDILQHFYRERQFNPQSNLLYGEGGAGTYSDGKVYTRLSAPDVRDVLGTFVRFGADPSIFIDGKPHIGSDRLPTICRHIREYIQRLGGEIRFDAQVDDFEMRDGAIAAIRIGDQRIDVEPVLLGIGHSARDTIARLIERGVRVDAKPFQCGVRIEHPQAMVDRWQYGDACGDDRLPPADYRIVARRAADSAGDLFSFCMCPGGQILPTNESPGLIVTNGASRSSRGGPFANSGFVITIDPARFGNDPLAAIRFQEELERRAFVAGGSDYSVPAQRCHDFLAGRSSDGKLETSYPLGGKWIKMDELMPPDIIAALRKGLNIIERKWPGFSGENGVITAPETRASAPVRITRDRDTRQSVTVKNLYPVGEGAGYAGGIVSAAIDGLRSADAIIQLYKPIQ